LNGSLSSYVSYEERDMSNLVHNEKIKMMAVLWSNLAVASVTASWLVPAFSWSLGPPIDILTMSMIIRSMIHQALVVTFGLGLSVFFYARHNIFWIAWKNESGLPSPA